MVQPIHPPAAPALLIAITGTPGQGRTRLLAELAAEFRAAGKRVEGALAIAGARPTPGEGAATYRLHLLGESEELPWAERLDGTEGAYAFDPKTHRRLRGWADGLRTNSPAPLLVLDEFGPCEARGEGLMPLWPTLAASAPQIAVLSVRAEYVEQIEQRLGRRFDLRVAAADPAAAEQLRRACADFGEWTRLGLWGGAAGGVEMTFGSMLHAMRVPFRGLALSSLQAAMMTFASAGLSQPGRVIWVPLISAGLKALSPGGGRIRPMLAISAQGALFSSCVQVLGWNAAAILLGGALIGAWAALQGFLVQYLLLGEELVQTYQQLVLWLANNWQINAPSMPALLSAWTLAHALAAGGAAVFAWRLRAPPRALQRIIDRELAALAGTAQPAPSRLRRILREFARWQFWLPFLIVLLVLLGTGRNWESLGWLALRFVAVGFVLLSLLSLFQPARMAERLRERGWWGPAAAFSGAIQRRRF